MFSTCRGSAGVEGGSSLRSPVRWLKLTSRTTMLLDDTNSSGKPPDSELRDRLRWRRLVRLPRDGEMDPSRPREASETSVTAPLGPPQVIPSHEQQSLSLRHVAARPPSRESPARSRRRELLSCAVQELDGEAKETSSSKSAKPTKAL
ncbi:hypothetical protein CFC21_087397 [Triticum aestivum]|uniref:Uncharacterized protein n=2 Tax=Triticum aestivum TaxID=4565 RepID=A0A9R1IH49_WHEAT|nr:hypothetical protein CFC21_087397 [Triticum aestivum]